MMFFKENGVVLAVPPHQSHVVGFTLHTVYIFHILFIFNIFPRPQSIIILPNDNE